MPFYYQENSAEAGLFCLSSGQHMSFEIISLHRKQLRLSHFVVISVSNTLVSTVKLLATGGENAWHHTFGSISAQSVTWYKLRSI